MRKHIEKNNNLIEEYFHITASLGSLSPYEIKTI